MTIYEDLKDAVVVLTGGANGIGEAMTRAFVAQGAKVHFCDMDAKKGEVLATETGASFQSLDLRDEAALVSWIGGITGQHGRVNALVNNAARDPRIKLEDMTSEVWDDLMATNLRPYMLTARQCVPHMPEGGCIVNFSSIVFELGMQPMSAYVTTKAGIQGMTRSLGRELGPKRIRVNSISPGWVMTERQIEEFVTDEALANLQENLQSIPDLIQPADLAEVALFLASTASRSITGQEIVADHGWVHS